MNQTEKHKILYLTTSQGYIFLRLYIPPIYIPGYIFLQCYIFRDRNGLFSDQKGGNKLLSVAKISARQELCCCQMLLPDGRGRRALLQSPFGRHEVNIAEKRLEKSVYLSRNGSGFMLCWSGPSYQVSLHCGLTLPHVMLACDCSGLPRNFERYRALR